MAICDIELPEGNGLDLMRELSVRHPMKGIALTACATDAQRTMGRKAGFDIYLIKPVEFHNLRAAIRELS